jgi:hypothetical protein
MPKVRVATAAERQLLQVEEAGRAFEVGEGRRVLRAGVRSPRGW